MARRLSPAERLAEADKDLLLEQIVARTSDWDRFLVEQAVYALGLMKGTFSANDARDLLPDLAHGFLGAAFNALAGGRVIEKTGDLVPSTSAATHGHGIYVWRLTDKGRAIAEARRPKTGTEAAA